MSGWSALQASGTALEATFGINDVDGFLFDVAVRNAAPLWLQVGKAVGQAAGGCLRNHKALSQKSSFVPSCYADLVFFL